MENCCVIGCNSRSERKLRNITFHFVAATEWSKLFPLALEDCTSSATFMKKITIIIISSITYLKEVLPPSSFIEESFQGIRLRILKNDCGNKIAQFVSRSLADAFDAVDKRYLHKLALCFYEGECKFGNMLESHVFEYIYNDDRLSVNITSKDKDTCRQTKYTFEQQTVNLVQATLVLMGSCQNLLPLTYGLSLRLYYNEDTPDDYHAPGFTLDEGADHFQHFAIKGLKVGRVDTAFHKLSLLSYVKEHTAGASLEVIPTQNRSILSNNTDEELDFEDRSARDAPRMSCPCTKHDDKSRHNDDELLTCHYCNTQQHAACFGVFDDATSLSRHCCCACRDADPTRTPTDLKLMPLSQIKRASITPKIVEYLLHNLRPSSFYLSDSEALFLIRAAMVTMHSWQCLCIFRRTLKFCSHIDSVDARAISDRFRMSVGNASKLMKMLYRHRVIQQDPDDSNNPLIISKKHLKQSLIKFSNEKQENLTDRLIGEIEGALSQESCQSNLIEEVLTPIEKQDIRNISNLGRLIEKPVKKLFVEDSTLKQYREVLVAEEIKDPLRNLHVGNEEPAKRKSEIPVMCDTGNKKTRLQLKYKKNHNYLVNTQNIE